MSASIGPITSTGSMPRPMSVKSAPTSANRSWPIPRSPSRPELQPFDLHVDQAVPIGLIVNKLVTNAIKYAFAPGRKGTILVRFRVLDDRATLTVSRKTRNGWGLPADEPDGVGMQLVRALANRSMPSSGWSAGTA